MTGIAQVPDTVPTDRADILKAEESGRPRRKLVSIVIPAYNEEGNIPRLETELLAALDGLPYEFEFIVIDNSSTDRTGELVKEICRRDPRWRYIRFSRNFLVESSIAAGYRYASGEAMIVLYSDLQEPPHVIPQMLEKWKQGYDIVHGIHTARLGERPLLTLLVRIAYRLVNWCSDVPIPPDSGDFRLISSPVRDALEQCGEHHRYTRGLIPWLGFSQTGVNYVREPRKVGISKSPFSVYCLYFANAITSFSMKPLRIFFIVGACIVALATVPAAVTARFALTGSSYTGIMAIITLLVLAMGFNSVGLGILGEYIGRTYTEVRRRPRYVIKETVNLEAGARLADEAAAGIQLNEANS